MSSHNISYSIKKNKKITLSSYGFCSKGLKNEFEIAVVNQPSMFESLKFCCMYHHNLVMHIKFYQNCLINASIIALDLI